MSDSRPSLLRFDRFEMDVESGELRKDGVRLRLPQQPFKVLQVLTARPGQVITREQIKQEIWGDGTHVDFESGLNYCIKQIRAALGDSPTTPQYVETLSKRGYRFVAEVARDEGRRPQTVDRPILAVLPFGNLSGPDAGDYFADGLTEELTAQLGRLNPAELGVIAFTTTRQYRSTSKGIDQIGRELGVQYIVEGSVRRAPDRLRITVQLIKVSDQTHLWASAYNRAMDDVIGIQIDVAERVAQALTVGLFARNKLSMERAATRNAEAYEAYLRGRHYFNRRRSVDDFQKATRHFEEAIENDPEYVLAHVGLADVYTVMGLHSHIEPRQAYRAAIKHLDRAFALDPNVAEAQYSMAYARALYERDFDGADTSFQHALALNPNYVTGRYWYALLLAAMGRFDRAIEHIEGALALDPLSLVTNSNKGWILYLARRYDEAATQLMSTLDMDQSFALAHYFLGLVLVQQGRHGQAATEFASAQQASGNHPASISGLAVAQALGGAREKARVTLKKLKELTRNRYVTPYYLAVVHAALGETDRAFSLLKDACDDGSAFLTNMNHDPGLDALREDPRFRRMTVRLGLDKARAAKA